MYEVEIKVRADHGPVRERLGDLGADRLERVVQADTYYEAPDRSFAETDEALRIRRETPEVGDRRVRITYKGPKVDDATKTREEFETTVEDGDAAASILDALGYEAAATVRKERTVYAVEDDERPDGGGDYEVTLDSVDGLGTFVEVETEAERADVDAAREGARDLLDRLDLDPDSGIRESYLELLLAAAGE